MSVRLLFFFLSLGRFLGLSCLCIPCRNRSVWASQTHDIGLNYFLPFSESVSPICARWSWEDSRRKIHITQHPELQPQKSPKVFSCDIQPKLWEVKLAGIINILTHDVSGLAHQYPSRVLVFWPETVAPPEVQLVLALISCVWHAQTAWVCVYTPRSTLYITHTGSRYILNCFIHCEEQDISLTGAAFFSINNQFI